jgi:hypothetical protein
MRCGCRRPRSCRTARCHRHPQLGEGKVVFGQAVVRYKSNQTPPTAQARPAAGQPSRKVRLHPFSWPSIDPSASPQTPWQAPKLHKKPHKVPCWLRAEATSRASTPLPIVPNNSRTYPPDNRPKRGLALATCTTRTRTCVGCTNSHHACKRMDPGSRGRGGKAPWSAAPWSSYPSLAMPLRRMYVGTSPSCAVPRYLTGRPAQVCLALRGNEPQPCPPATPLIPAGLCPKTGGSVAGL